jgi:hypothetical protein
MATSLMYNDIPPAYPKVVYSILLLNMFLLAYKEKRILLSGLEYTVIYNPL